MVMLSILGVGQMTLEGLSGQYQVRKLDLNSGGFDCKFHALVLPSWALLRQDL